ncbi:carbonic anhydrase [Flavobacterium agricola]|uniref:carbonic anhydrase n=1 Tax=Flavobacterium agricola TaxID=2870839 RepID=A0ABY6LZL1_9FLAO|nr:carbonic anhydrase [Flavobacterium agricola]UYW01721.1 carbonic anhydrase [Flavobacterium agricola]
MDFDKIFEHNKKWINKQLENNKNYFGELAEGQSPEVLYIGCSDSRVTAEELMGAKPGQVFVHRNIANMIPNTDLNSQSVINYAVNFLGVKHIVVCGHYECGGIKSAMQQSDLGILNPWLRNIRDVYRLHNKELTAIADEKKRYDRLVELNVQEQCINVMKTAEVQKAIVERNLKVHGWIFDLHTGQIIDLNIDLEAKMQHIQSIYKLV